MPEKPIVWSVYIHERSMPSLCLILPLTALESQTAAFPPSLSSRPLMIALWTLGILSLCCVARAAEPLETIRIPLTVDSEQRYTARVAMVRSKLLLCLYQLNLRPSQSTSPHLQHFSFLLTTATGYSVVAGSECSACDHAPLCVHGSFSQTIPSWSD